MAPDQDQAAGRSRGHRVRHAVRVLATAPVWLYQHVISPGLPPHCIYNPTCSHYMRDAILKHGLLGALAGLLRVLRCAGGLFTGGEDPVPDRLTAGYLLGSYRHFLRRRKR